MAVAFLFELPGVTQAQYDQIVAEIGTSEPKRLYHVAGPTEAGWRVVDVWESEEAFQEFVRERLGPAAERAGVKPEVEPWTVHNIIANPATIPA